VVGILAAAAAGAQESPPPADQTPPAPAAATELEEVVVTGSRIMRATALESTIPVTSVAASELMNQGDISIGDALNDLPSLRSSFSQGNSSRFIGTAGLNWLDLRGLGVERTLVLVNGRRHITSSPGSYLVDVNTIPSELIERVDVVTGGNSAIYGSDAVAGTVNFVTKRDYEGVDFRGQGGVSNKGDRESYFASVTAGMNFADNRGNVALALEYGKQEPLLWTEREKVTGAVSGRNQFNLAEPVAGEPAAGDGIPDNQFFRNVFSTAYADGGVIFHSSATTCAGLAEPARSLRCLPNGQPRLFSFDPSGNLVESIPSQDFRPFGSGNIRLVGYPPQAGSLSTLNNTGQLAVGLERSSINLLAHYDVNDAFRPFVEAKFVHLQVDQETSPSFAPNTLPYSLWYGGPDLRCDNPFLSAQALGVLQSVGRCLDPATGTLNLGRNNVDFGSRGEDTTRDTYRIVLGFDGTFNDDWRYEVAFNYGRLETDMRSTNNLLLFDINGDPDGFNLAYDAVRNGAGQIVCRVNDDGDPTNDRPDCVPINLFGNGAPSRAALDFSHTDAFREETAEQIVASAFFSGDSSQLFELPAGPVGFALGTEYRIEKAESIWDELTASGGTFLNAIAPFVPPDLKVAEVFGEVRVPLLAGLPFAYELTAEAAYRYSNYDTNVDTVDAYNIGLVYAPIQDLRFRYNYSTSVRAPTQDDLYSPQSQNYPQVNDPCDVLYINLNPNRPANCAAAGVPVGFENIPARLASTSILQGGNPFLVEEEGTSYTIGMVLTPAALPGFAFAVDYYNIEVENLIAVLGAQTILNECYNSPSGINNPFCVTIRRNPDSTFDDPALIAGGVNFQAQETEGVDFDVSYQTTFDNGHRFGARVIATRLLELTNYLSPSDPTFGNRQKSELGDPDLAFNVDINYGFGAVDLNYSARYIGHQTIGAYEAQHSFQGRAPENADQFPEKYFPSYTVHGIRGEVGLNDMVSVFVGVDNFTDEMPPYGRNGTTNGEPWDAIGAYYYAGVKVGL
jgi:outer membrane receptor protein involved in Fe transport